MPNAKAPKPVVHTKKHIARLERERQQTRILLFAFIGVIVVIVGLIGYGYLDVNYFQPRRPVAIIGKDQITRDQLYARVRLQRQQLVITYSQYSQYAQMFGMDVTQQLQQIQGQLDAPAQLGQTVLDQMVNEILIRQEAAKRGITVSKDEVDAAMHDAYGFYPNGSPTPTLTPTDVTMPTVPAEAYKIVTITPTGTATPVGTPTLAPTATTGPGTPTSAVTLEASPTLTVTLAPTATETAGPTPTALPTSTPYTLQGFQTQEAQTTSNLSKFGFSESDFRALYEAGIYKQKLFDIITTDVPHTQQQVWARHILVKDEATAKTVEQRLKNGEDFAKVAAEVSQDTGSKGNGGDLGWFGKGQMVPEFETAAFSLPIGQISDPVKSSFGYHIIQVIARQDRPLSASQYDQAKQTAFTDWLTKAKKDYGVQTFDVWQANVPTDPSLGTAAPQ